ncbi:MAG TPA: NAD-dependent epimerase/dehydratase family protein, partial [Chryseolinea sp.]|nr:NAD-dependent epimerase/dehydratase family protein [Chryseolinea sp.]
MAILLTGGSGFIGSHFHTAIPNHDIINLDLERPNFPFKSAFVQGDIRIEKDVRKAVANHGITSIISLAAKHHDFGIGHDEYFDTNEDGTRIICKVAADYNINEIIFYSSVAVYGIREEISTENLETKPDSPYGESKLAGEKVLIEWAKEKPERKVLIIRPTLVFGKNNMANMRNLIKQIDSGLYFHLGKADNVKSIAYVENLVQATLFLKERMKLGVSIYNYADEPQLTTRDISNVIAETLNKKIRLSVPKTLGVMMG